MTPRERAVALLDRADTRGSVKRLAPELDADPILRRAVLEEGRARGVDLPDEASEWPAPKLLRRARGREAESQVRTNPIRRDEAFTCAHCGRAVEALGRTARDHCPTCLRSLHVDVVPGDRASGCGGILDPVGAELQGGQVVLHHVCRRCGHRHRVKAIDGPDGDDWDAVIATTAGEPPP
ncbi:MAG: RNHCP domain-containing protein [Myxococcota bacterium]